MDRNRITRFENLLRREKSRRIGHQKIHNGSASANFRTARKNKKMETTNGQLADNYRKDGFLTGIHISDEVEATRHRQAYNALEAEVGCREM